MLTVLFIGLWCLADREGRLEDRPKRIGAEIFPYRECHEINRYLTDLADLRFIRRYTVGEAGYIQVLNFRKHQSPHRTEKASEIPEPPDESESCDVTKAVPLNNESHTVKESLIPDSCFLIPEREGEQKNAPAKRGKGSKKNGQQKFVKPDLSEIRDYCDRIGAKINPVAFYNYYESVGWKVGKNPMKDWQAAVRKWNSDIRS